MKRITTLFLACLLTLNLFGCSKKIDPAAQIVIDEITELTESNQIDFAALEKAKERYNSLTDDQKKQVTNYAELLKLEDSYQDAVEAAVAEAEYNDTHIPDTDWLSPNGVCSVKSQSMEDMGPSNVGDDRYKYIYSSYDEAKKAYDEYIEWAAQFFEKNTTVEGKTTTTTYTYDNGSNDHIGPCPVPDNKNYFIITVTRN